MAKPKWYTLFAWGWTALFVVVLGLTLFLLLWEARSRYLLNFLPVMLAAAFPAVDEGRQSV